MAREFFKNLPDKSTPLTAPRLNRMLNGEESIEKIVVGDIECKNLLNSDAPSYIANGIKWTGSGISHKLTNANAWGGGIGWFIPVKAGEKYVFSYKQRNSEVLFLYIRERSAMNTDNSSLLKTIVGDGTGTEYSFTIENDCYLLIYFDNSWAISDVLIEEIQLERGTTKTSFSLFKKIGYNSIDSMGEIVVDDISCKNLFNFDNMVMSYGNIDYVNKTITFNGFNNATLNTLKDICPDLKVGETYTFSFTTMSEVNHIYLNGSQNIWWAGTPHIITQAELDNSILFYGTTGVDCVISDIQIEKGTVATECTPYKSLGYTSGSNENGSWVKYDDGRMECEGKITIDSGIGYGTVIFPQAFIDTNYTIVSNCVYTSNSEELKIIAVPQIKDVASCYINSITPTEFNPTFSRMHHYIAKGRWK